MDLIIGPTGTVRGLYSESIELKTIGSLSIKRASHVEPTANGEWAVDLSPADGPCLGPFRLRSEALAAEAEWLLEQRLLKHR